MKNCRVSNYSNARYSGTVTSHVSELKSPNVDELIEDVYSVLLKCSFSTDIDDSLDEDAYVDSIDALVKLVGVALSKANLPFELSTQDKARITRALKNKLLPRPLTKAELQISAIIKGTDLIRDEDILQIRYKKMLSDVYGTSNPGMDAWRLRIFEDDLALATIIDTRGDGMIIDSDEKLNNNIINYLESQYKIIRDYLVHYHLLDADVGQFPQHLYITSAQGIKVKTQNHYNTITAMYNIIESLKNEGTFLDSIENGWNEDIDKVREISLNRELYNAVNAFINLTYFDDVLKYSLSKFITIKPQLNPIQYTVDANNTYTYYYKYLIATGNSNARKTWGDEVSDSLEEMAKFNLVIINRISLYDYKDEVEQWGRLEPKDFVGTIVKLKSAGTLVTDNEFRDAVENLTKDQSRKNGNLQTIFRKLFIDKNLNIIRELESRGFDYNNMNVLYSIYRTVFDTRNKTKLNGRQNKSWLEIEEVYLRKKGIHSRYNLVEAIYGMICSNTALNYLLTVYDFDTLTTKTTIKDKYSISKTKFDIINDINENTIKRQDTTQLLDEYKLTPMANGYSINIAGKDYQIKVNGLGINLLSKKNVSASRFQIKELEGLKGVSLNTRELRNALVSRHNLTALETQLADVLSFIDNMLNTDFSKNTLSLNELVISMKGRPNFLHDIFMSAARALVIQDIYNNFRKATKEDGSTYALTELRTFLKDSGKFQGIYDARNLYEYFRTDFDGYQLTTVDSNEPWIVKLAITRALLANDTSKSVISNLDGSKIPNSSPAFLSGDIKTQMRESNEAVGPTAYLLFSGNRKAILEVGVNTDVKTKDGKVKLIKNMTEGELLYDALVNKFLLPLHDDGTIFTQSTTQSDKTKFIADHINLGDIIIDNQKLTDLIKSSALELAVVSKLKSTIGTAYNKVYERVIEDYKRLFPQIKGIDDISKVLKGIPTKLATGEEVTINSEKDLMNAVNSYNKANPNNTITFYKDLHYRQIKEKKLAFNELLYEFATNLYNPNDSTRLNLRLALEKRRFLNNLLEKQFFIPVDELMKSIMKQTFGLNTEQWTRKVGDEEYVVLAKSGNENILYGSIEDDTDFTLNPMLNAYFLIDNLIGNNLRFSTTGSEINHKIKALAKLNLKKKIKNENINKRNILLLNPEYDQSLLTFYDLKKMIDKGKELIAKGTKTEGVPLENTIADLETTYNDLIYVMENLGQNAQFKRNVIMSATMTKMVPSLEGICEQMNIACISDVPADVFNFSGKTDTVDAHDGSAQLSPFWSRLENKSLGPNEVGTIKKPIQHYYDDRYMTATLLKYATDTITNLWMRQSVGNDLNSTKHAINLHNVFRKMHNKRWHVVDAQGKSIEGAWNDGEIDLIKGCGYKIGHKILFADDIMELKLYPNNILYYNNAGTHIKIVDFGRENGVYYTVEEAVDLNANSYKDGTLYKVYHYFDNTGNHIPSEHILENTPYHTIDSLFELHTALGGIWSESYNGENFVYSEGSIIAVTNYINHVATLKEGADPKDLSIKSYDLPLKRAMIHVIANNSAVKNGVGNINPTSSWYDNTEFSYMTIGSDTYGILLDSDHTADEAHMTEFSQVISSLDAGGYLHDYVALIYQLLGQTALDLSKVELDAVDLFEESGNISAIYDVIGRTIMANIKSGKGEIGLAEAIINNIKTKFNLNTDHSLDKLKIPFSDPNIYSSILSTFVSNINKKSIKRLYPGLGTVMVPSYNMSMIYDINGMTYLFEDLVKEATEKGFLSTERDNTKAKLDIVKLYLSTIQLSMPVYEDGQSFIPTENVLVTLEGTNALGQTGTFQEHISLNEIHDYYNFLDNPQEYLKERGYSNISSMKFQKDVTVPRNLAPARITWDYVDALGVQHHTNIFNHWRVKGLILELAKIKGMKISEDEKKRLSAEAVKKWNVDKAFHDLKKGMYELALGAEPVEISNLKNEAAEIIMSNLYASKFGIKAGDSLVDVLKKGKSYFSTPTVSVNSDNYDLVFTKGNGNHTFITFKPLLKNSDNCMSFYRAWDNINKRKYLRKYEVSENSPTVVNRIYAITEDNVRLFEIGREIVRDDIVWDNKKEAFVKGGKKVENQNIYRRDGDRVLQYIEFVSKHRVNETMNNGSIISYDLYNINRSAIKRCLELKQYSDAELTYTNAEGHTSKLTPELKFDLEVNLYISKLLGDIYKSDEYGGILLNKSLSFGSGKVLLETLYNFSKEIDYDLDLSEYVVSLYKMMRAANPNKNDNNRFTINAINLRKALRAFDAKNRNKLYTSFQKSLYFTVARIPAQTLQSFMKMKNVGFTGTETGQCFVTAWLTWLQGSDYRQNCSL